MIAEIMRLAASKPAIPLGFIVCRILLAPPVKTGCNLLQPLENLSERMHLNPGRLRLGSEA
jgi:hypothetical protein